MIYGPDPSSTSCSKIALGEELSKATETVDMFAERVYGYEKRDRHRQTQTSVYQSNGQEVGGKFPLDVVSDPHRTLLVSERREHVY